MADAAFEAVGFAGCADIASVEYQPVVGLGDEVLGNVGDESLFGLEGSLGVFGQTDAIADTEDMGVDSHCCLIPHHGEHHIGSLTTDARQTHQLVDVARQFATKLVDYESCSVDKVTGFVVGEGDAFDVVEDFFGCGCCQVFRLGISVKEGGCDDVDTLVGALSREDYCQQQMERRVVV